MEADGRGMEEGKRVEQKWGFGMAPISYGMRRCYNSAVQTTLNLLYGHVDASEVVVNDISQLKGMFNRSIRQDQWDWQSVYTEIGSPTPRHMRYIADKLITLRRSILDGDAATLESTKQGLIDNNILGYLHNYEQHMYSPNSPELGGKNTGWIYILSTRENRAILKIGMTRRSVHERVREINSATGVVIPFAVRKMFRVKDAQVAEREIFALLRQYRIREDREFFSVDFLRASALIQKYLAESRMELRHEGEVIWFDPAKGYGFISPSDQGEDLLLHEAQIIDGDTYRIMPGTQVEFDVGRRLEGPCAFQVRVIG